MRLQQLQFFSRKILDFEHYLLDSFWIQGVVLYQLYDIIFSHLFSHLLALVDIYRFFLSKQFHRAILAVLNLYFRVNNAVYISLFYIVIAFLDEFVYGVSLTNVVVRKLYQFLAILLHNIVAFVLHLCLIALVSYLLRSHSIRSIISRGNLSYLDAVFSWENKGLLE